MIIHVFDNHRAFQTSKIGPRALRGDESCFSIAKEGSVFLSLGRGQAVDEVRGAVGVSWGNAESTMEKWWLKHEKWWFNMV